MYILCMYVCIVGTISTYTYCTHTSAQGLKSTNIRALIMFKKMQSNQKLSKEEKKENKLIFKARHLQLSSFNTTIL